MDSKKIVRIVLAVALLALVVGAVVFVVNLIKGLVGGVFNLILGVVTVLAMAAIVAWMFWYAARNK